ncbi:EF-hand domain-containing protein [Streptomyces antimicrobicus]|uniref:EF-hand domain-containing protein n=1 Tax=Streptomyces antimicrobicus TaxID=2883108 RepID=A0ABS8B3Q3_9ACTN|nr:EF-hand domain-containing protein [Streptomyces antimicrobicus]MCB5179234.1 EF-hand domain-containing protein [Streptomyces antimicrobicus]
MAGEADASAEVRAAFGRFDTDDDWLLDMHEFGRALARLTGRDRSAQEVERLFRVTDVDGDGLVSLPEFEECVRHGPAAPDGDPHGPA